MEDLHNVGGTPGVLKYMLEKGHLHGDCLTVRCADCLSISTEYL